ncbi:hypothetical protein [Jannaschia seohaensis]|uniref:YiaAB two helix domain-containing protein n=1 Tax=Jannaschia seohaensis TaxID=475081 RepID=A0A2Y9ATQ9_9RHOB|nr:hypothetical protein [Jannaschia seohaensis]PWJ17403.1 hypothetical protein BCF38_10613 [Jannaschia seohaensis]SSA47466.1 hypothetical protein SAMN05421539_10613 [Jannaschia seohaensis]
MTRTDDTRLITSLNFFGVLLAYVMLGASLWLSVDVPLATKGYWAIAVLMLTISLVNFVKYRFDARLAADRDPKPEPRTPRLAQTGADKAA